MTELKAGGKTRIFWLTYQPHSSSADCAGELFKPSKIRQVYEFAVKKKFWLWIIFFCEWHHKWVMFLAIFGCWYLTWAQPLDRSISLKFSLETRQESASIETLINFLVFLVQKLWSKINEVIYPIYNYFLCLFTATRDRHLRIVYNSGKAKPEYWHLFCFFPSMRCTRRLLWKRFSTSKPRRPTQHTFLNLALAINNYHFIQKYVCAMFQPQF